MRQQLACNPNTKLTARWLAAALRSTCFLCARCGLPESMREMARLKEAHTRSYSPEYATVLLFVVCLGGSHHCSKTTINRRRPERQKSTAMPMAAKHATANTTKYTKLRRSARR